MPACSTLDAPIMVDAANPQRARRRPGPTRIALVLYPGVMHDECTVFGSILGRIPGVELVTVAAAGGVVQGPGGSQTVDVTFADCVDVDIVVVPGGVGCERAADDARLRDWLRQAEPDAETIVSSSTGSVLLAAAGLLHGHAAATHWLATDLLQRYGSEYDENRLVVDGKVVTCAGRVSALDAAFTVVDRIAGPDEAARIRAELARAEEPTPPRRSWWCPARRDRR